jgi:hypothetical protein
MRCMLVFLLACAASLNAATIRATGVLGNSGEAGDGLLRVGRMPLENCASGAAVDQDSTLWLSGGDAINRVGLDGHLIERFPLDPAGSMVDSRTFAVLNGTLYFLARVKEQPIALFALPMRSGEKARPIPVKLPERKNEHVAYCLAPQPLNGQLVIATEPKATEGERIDVWLLNPATSEMKLAFSLKGSIPHGVAVDTARSVIYIGGHFGLYVGGETHGSVAAITAVRPDGKVLSDAFPAVCTKTPAIPTQFRGVISLAAGALWESAWYGFLARLDLEGRGAPGRIVEWHHELHYPTQFLGIRDGWAEPNPSGRDPILIATPMPDAFYFATWDSAERQLRLIRRIGCLPTISSLGLSEEGWVTAGTARTQLWWRWEDAADAVPRKAELHVAVTPVVFQGDRCFALAAPYHLSHLRNQTPLPTAFSSHVGDRNEASRVGTAVPMKQPIGSSVQIAPGKHNAVLFVTDAATRQLWRADFWLPELRPTSDKWQPVRIEGDALRAPTDVAALTDGRLLLADEGRILLLEPKGDGYAAARSWDHWGDAPDARLGKRLRFAVDGAWMLVSDTERHRVLWLDWTEWKVLGQAGETDKAGGDAAHLSAPTFAALRGTRALVADAGNQRILKLELAP